MKTKYLSILLIFALILTAFCLTACGTEPDVETDEVYSQSDNDLQAGESVTDDGEGQSLLSDEDEITESGGEADLQEAVDELLDEDGWYDSKEEVALYIHVYGKLPSNYITKKEAEKLGWSGGSLEPYAPGMSIGGSHFGNYEGLLPDGHDYTECDIDTAGAKSRGAKRIVFSDDGLIYYTEDHYESFELLYGRE